MCLLPIPKKEEKKVLSSLPDPFCCWKIVQKVGQCEFDNNCIGPKITRRGEYVAEDIPAFRMAITYEPGFHAYLKKPELFDANSWHSTTRRYHVRKFWVKKCDVIKTGTLTGDYHRKDDDTPTMCIVARNITRK